VARHVEQNEGIMIRRPGVCEVRHEILTETADRPQRLTAKGNDAYLRMAKGSVTVRVPKDFVSFPKLGEIAALT
jgi:hypothetical protein